MTNLERYTQLLQTHDWEYPFSDDQRVWRRGRDEWAEITRLMKLVDADRAIFNQYNPTSTSTGANK